jgi:uncharacterized protein (TIGR02145 family)
MSSCPNIVTVGTNTPGFQLLFKTNNANLVNTTTPSYTIPSRSSTTPGQLLVNTWGYAIPKTDSTSTQPNTTNLDHDITGIPTGILSAFNNTYTTRTDTNPIPADIYAKTPTTDAIIKQISSTDTGFDKADLQNNDTTIFYAAAADLNTYAGTYKTTIIYTAIGEEVPEPPEIACVSGSKFKGNVGDIRNAAAKTAAWDIGYTGIATDTRGDGQQYCIGKLADDNVWMLNNLKLGSLDEDLYLTTDDTNITADWTLPQIDNNATGHYYDTPHTYALLSSDSYYDPALPNSQETNINSQNFAGYYYNWCAATAGLASTTCKPSGTMPPDATQDICPANWRMPTGGSSGEFAILNGSMHNNTPSPASTLTSNTIAANFRFTGPFRGVPSGLRQGSIWSSQGDRWLVWSASHDINSYNASVLMFDLIDNVYANVYTAWRWDRVSNFSVRCLLQ